MAPIWWVGGADRKPLPFRGGVGVGESDNSLDIDGNVPGMA